MRAVAALAVLVLSACGSDLLPPPIDPVLMALRADPPIIGTGGRSTLSAEGHDREGLPLTYRWEVSGGTLEGTGDSVTWIAPGEEGTYTVYLTLIDEEGGTAGDSVLVDVWDGSLLVNTGGGLLAYNFDETQHKLTEGRDLPGTHFLKGDDIEVRGTEIFVSGVYAGYQIFSMTHEGQLFSSTTTFRPDIHAAGFTALPGGGFAVLDNLNDTVHFAGPDGSHRATVPIPDARPGRLGIQNLDGLVAGNQLIASETGYQKVFSVDLNTYEADVFFEFPEKDAHLGAIAQDGDGNFHMYVFIDGRREIHSFTRKGDLKKLCTLPEDHVSALVAVGAHIFATVNRAGAVYRINRFTRKYKKILDGLDWPTDVEYLPVRLGGQPF